MTLLSPTGNWYPEHGENFVGLLNPLLYLLQLANDCDDHRGVKKALIFSKVYTEQYQKG